LVSQLAKPEAQVWMRQVGVIPTAPTHSAMASGSEHSVPQLPQFATEVSDVSQPFRSSPSQLSNPGLHVWMRHWGSSSEPALPAVHVGMAFVRAHAVPQLPQLASESSDVSHPSVATPLQSA
jgi:hypothetical protein